MRLVGASRWRTQLPFMIEAVVAGLIGAALAIGGLVVAKFLFVDQALGLGDQLRCCRRSMSATLVWPSRLVCWPSAPGWPRSPRTSRSGSTSGLNRRPAVGAAAGGRAAYGGLSGCHEQERHGYHRQEDRPPTGPATRAIADRVQPQGAARLRDHGHLRGRDLADRHRGEVAACRAGLAGRRVRHRRPTTRCGCAACTSPSTRRAPGPTTRRGGPASCCCTAPRSTSSLQRCGRAASRWFRCRCTSRDGRVKVELALARGKKEYDKRQTLAKRDADRELAKYAGRRAKGMG